jgi:D-alanyl-lipoteichoic acid acyltransferase DltB (MBOAT superfamily)
VHFVWLLASSVLFNYAVGLALLYRGPGAVRTGILTFGIVCDLLLLFFYKYFGPTVGFLTANGLASWSVVTIILPLGISFFTFTQIAYLLDTADGDVAERGFLNYVLFVTFYPHLIAGPILHHREIMPQFADRRTYCLTGENLAVGCSMFIIGLFKKSVIADQIGDFVPLAFDHPAANGMVAAWIGVLAYSVQLYFDFSGYSDMAIGLARMFGVRFPMNFNSPYKAANISDFWQRWHMTLTRWLMAYIYNPMLLRIMRRRAARASGRVSWDVSGFLVAGAFPLIVTMGLAGIWHGAGLTFLCFGLLHGVYLAVYRAWRTFGPKVARRAPSRPWLPSLLVRPRSVLLTYACVLVAQVFFRADSVQGALQVLTAMVGLNANAHAAALGPLSPNPLSPLLPILAALGIAFLCPNSQEIIGLAPRGSALLWVPNMRWALGMAVMFFISLLLIDNEQKFLYFQF